MGVVNRRTLFGVLIGLLFSSIAPAEQPVATPRYLEIGGARLRTVLATDGSQEPVWVPAFSMRETPVTRGEFSAFVSLHPEWRADRAPASLAGEGYLRGASGQMNLGDQAGTPVTQVSWFAAQAFCEAEGGRLPTWNEWELVAAADATHADARKNAAWRAKILGWYARPAGGPLPEVGGEPNYYGVRDLHGLIWEWVDDFNALLISPDSRAQDDPDKLKFCGAGAISLQDRENYAVLMRIALLSSLQASDSTSSLGFRCVRPAAQGN